MLPHGKKLTDVLEYDSMGWAKGPSGPIKASDGKLATCYECGERVTGVNGHTRMRNGIKQRVRAHFRHTAESSCTGESWQHKAAKHIIATKSFTWRVQCTGCSNSFEVEIEGTAAQEQYWAPYHLDVGYSVNSHVTGAVEVFYTHQVDEHKCAHMTNSNLAWVEVSANEVLSSTDRSVQVIRAAKSLCLQCTEKVKQAKAMTASAQKRLQYYNDAQQRLACARKNEQHRLSCLLIQVELEHQRLAQFQPSVNSVAANTLRQHLLLAQQHLSRARKHVSVKGYESTCKYEKCSVEDKWARGEYVPGFTPY